MKQYSIRQYVGLLTLAPMIVIATCLALIFLKNNFTELDNHVAERAKLLASQLGSSSEYGVVSNNQLFLQNLAHGISQQQDVSGVAILNSLSHILAEEGNFSRKETTIFFDAIQKMPENSSPIIRYFNESLFIFQPIMPQTVSLNELESIPISKPIGAIIMEINLKRTNTLKSKEIWYTLAMAMCFLMLTGYIVNIASRRIINPIKKLSDDIKAIGQGYLETRASQLTHLDELDVLSHGINLMAEQLKYERSALQQRVVNATLDIIKSKEKAEQATLSKSRFLAAASHDLRQPIHALGLFLDVLSRTELSAHQRDLTEKARAVSDASSDMINTLLDYSRIEAGVIKPHMLPFRLQPLLNKIENELAPLADDKGIVYRTRETRLVVQSDSSLVEVILRNLVSNAIRYTKCGGLLVACRRRGEMAVLEVWDTGIGIAPELQNEVFREFHQLGISELDHHNGLGLGLGLAIAQGLTKTLEVDLSLSSVPNRGSVFRFNLPIANIPLPVKQQELALNMSQPLNARVLVIDDDETVLLGMCHLLRDWGCECDKAESIEVALTLASSRLPDVVISDYRLSERRTGIEAISRLRELAGNSLPVLLISGDASSDLLSEAQARGIPLMHKPVLPNQLYRYLVEVLK